MESLKNSGAPTRFDEIFRGKRVWLSGHTGFKGSWLAHWLTNLGAVVRGFAIPPDSAALFSQLELAGRVESQAGDLHNASQVTESIVSFRPDFVFHLGAQAIVRLSFTDPVGTYTTNLLGTIHVMEALRHLTNRCAAILVTTDKCYENREWVHGYREEDPLGGYDPYSSSKAAAEIAICSWRRSFFSGLPVRIASARAGNVIGGGDWAKDRIVPDCVRALQKGNPIGVRNPHSTRPWQHVLEPLSGYLWLAAVLGNPSLRPHQPDLYASAFNFGPPLDANRTVGDLVRTLLVHWPGSWEDQSDPSAVHEARQLNLATDKAFHLLGFKPVWTFEQAVEATVKWYRTVSEGGDPAEITSRQIADYSRAARSQGLPWAVSS